MERLANWEPACPALDACAIPPPRSPALSAMHGLWWWYEGCQAAPSTLLDAGETFYAYLAGDCGGGAPAHVQMWLSLPSTQHPGGISMGML